MVKVGYEGGHGKKTAGKQTPNGEKEWLFNDVVARAFASELALYEDVELKRFDDPTGARDVPLQERTDSANKWGAEYYFSFHHNAFAGKWGTHTGVETHIYSKPSEESIELANAIHPALVEAYGLKDRGIKKSNLHIVREMECASVLIEGGFMDSKIDIVKLRDKKVLEAAGKGIARDFAKFAKLKKKVVVVPKPAATNKPSTPNPTPKADEKYVVAKSVNGYITAANAKERKAKASTVKAGTYYVYKVANGMINISSKKGVPGSWINPSDNKAVTPSTKVTHTVKKDDTLYSLSKKHGVSVAKIQELNAMGKNTLLKVGKVLTIKK